MFKGDKLDKKLDFLKITFLDKKPRKSQFEW